MTYYFIINPIAGRGRSKEMGEKIKQILDKKNISFEIYSTNAPHDAENFVREKCKIGEKCRFYVAGGDGTFHEVVNGAYGFSNAAVGIMPLGTGNDFVKNFTNKELFFDMKAQVFGKEIEIDLIRINDRYSVNVINIGFDCDSGDKAKELRRKFGIKGMTGYLMGVGLQFCVPRGNYMTISSYGEDIYSGKFLLCTIANGSFYGGTFQAAPYAQIDNGIMDLCIVKIYKIPALVKLLLPYHKGTHLEKIKDENLISFSRHKQLELKVEKPLLVGIDGEIQFFTELNMEVVPSAIKFILPKGMEKLEKKEPLL